MRGDSPLVALSALCLILLLLSGLSSRPATSSSVPSPRARQLGLPADTLVRVASRQRVEDFDQEICQFETVFWEPRDTESLRRLIRDTPLVRDKTVLEIGTGTGLVALCCLVAGAERVVATDVNPSAIANAAYNAEVLGVAERLQTRLVPLDAPAAYSVIGAEETFDLIISNPPWEDRRPGNLAEYALYDEDFALLRSMLSGLRAHLRPGGKLLLAYGCVTAIRAAHQLADQYDLEIRTLDDRRLDELPENFLPGMLLEITTESRVEGPESRAGG